MAIDVTIQTTALLNRITVSTQSEFPTQTEDLPTLTMPCVKIQLYQPLHLMSGSSAMVAGNAQSKNHAGPSLIRNTEKAVQHNHCTQMQQVSLRYI